MRILTRLSRDIFLVSKAKCKHDKVLGDGLFLVGPTSEDLHTGRDPVSPLSHHDSSILVTSAQPSTTCKHRHLRDQGFSRGIHS